MMDVRCAAAVLGLLLLAGACGGLLGGLAGVPGPPLVMWVMAHDWSADVTRAFLFASFMCLVPVEYQK